MTPWKPTLQLGNLAGLLGRGFSSFPQRTWGDCWEVRVGHTLTACWIHWDPRARAWRPGTFSSCTRSPAHTTPEPWILITGRFSRAALALNKNKVNNSDKRTQNKSSCFLTLLPVIVFYQSSLNNVLRSRDTVLSIKSCPQTDAFPADCMRHSPKNKVSFVILKHFGT